MMAGNLSQAVAAFGEWNRFHSQSHWSYVKYAVALARNGQCDQAQERIGQAARLAVFDYIETYHSRMHSALEYQSPAQYEERFNRLRHVP